MRTLNISDMRILFYCSPIFACTIMSDYDNTPSPIKGEIKFQVQVITKMMNFMMGNMCDKLDKVDKDGNIDGTSTLDARKVRAELKSNNGSRAKMPRCDDYKVFKALMLLRRRF